MSANDILILIVGFVGAAIMFWVLSRMKKDNLSEDSL